MKLSLTYRERLGGILQPVADEFDALIAQIQGAGIIASYDRPVCILYNTVTQTLQNTTYTAMSLNTSDTDTRAMGSTAASTITIPETGGYFVYASIWWPQVADTLARAVHVTKNTGSSFNQANDVAGEQAPNVGTTGVTATQAVNIVNLSQGDVLAVWGYQASGGALATAAANGAKGFFTTFTCIRLF